MEAEIATFTCLDSMTEYEVRQAYARHILAACKGNKARAAKRLGIDRRSLYRRLEGIREPMGQIRLTAPFGAYKPDDVLDFYDVVNHGGHSDAACQYVLVDGTHVLDTYAERA